MRKNPGTPTLDFNLSKKYVFYNAYALKIYYLFIATVSITLTNTTLQIILE